MRQILEGIDGKKSPPFPHHKLTVRVLLTNKTRQILDLCTFIAHKKEEEG